MQTAILILARYVGFAWVVAALWIGSLLLQNTARRTPIAARS
jgi:hypothetical protein